MGIQVVDHTPAGVEVLSCECGARWLSALNEKGRQLGYIREKFDIYQGGYRHGQTSASAGTHDGGGAFDFADYSERAVRLFREMGGAAWHRTTAQGFSGDHCHCILVGCPHHPSADYQVTAYRQGYNGLGDGWKGRDDGPRVHIRSWSDGIVWAGMEGELTVAQIDDLIKLIKAGQEQTHYDIGQTQKSIDGLPVKVVSKILAVKWGNAKNATLGNFLTDVRSKFYGGKK